MERAFYATPHDFPGGKGGLDQNTSHRRTEGGRALQRPPQRPRLGDRLAAVKAGGVDAEALTCPRCSADVWARMDTHARIRSLTRLGRGVQRSRRGLALTRLRHPDLCTYMRTHARTHALTLQFRYCTVMSTLYSLPSAGMLAEHGFVLGSEL
ncbi:hypothetical protein EGR_03348 [Echinococcus granulosus]|uniref:Uncharacterized protein n=1 Tax=Echinococcus granulosus TaxID=6210 RepID=W6UTV9_ECHGR|nr:hypothetical protein EGR_03348 [Echinococcus granulosus]EUB61802.1 hypothetical protein EGR_03348 [Echinococcus granulosus]